MEIGRVAWFAKLLGRGGGRRPEPRPVGRTPIAKTQAGRTPIARTPAVAAPALAKVAEEPARAPVKEAAPSLPRFQGSASEQLQGSLAGPLGRARMRLRDAFTPSQPVTDTTMFAGRAGLLEALIRAIEDQKLHVVLFGDRGMGKTSMLQVLGQQAQEARYFVRYVSCGEDSDFGEMFRAVVDGVPLLYHESYAPSVSEPDRGAVLGSLLPPGPVTPRRVSDLLAGIRGTRLLIILDEFDRAPAGLFRRQVAELIKNLSDRSTRAQLVIAGVAANLTELVEHIPSIRRNVLGLAVPRMVRDEVEAMIANGERVSGLVFSPEAVDDIADLAAGSPYLAGLLCQHAGIATVDRGTLDVETADVAVALGRAADEIGHRISERSRHVAARAGREGLGGALAFMAAAALAGGGRFAADDLSEAMPDDEARARAMTLASEHYGLIELVADDVADRWQFREEGVPSYLWLTAARSA